jgi:hypothetical protein
VGLGRELPDGRQRRSSLCIHEARTEDRVGERSEPSGRSPDTGTQLAPEALNEEDLEETDDDGGHAQPWVNELGVQALEQGLSPPVRPDLLGTERAGGGEGNGNARSTPEADSRGKQKDGARVLREVDDLLEWGPSTPLERRSLRTIGTVRLDRALTGPGEEQCAASSQRKGMS